MDVGRGGEVGRRVEVVVGVLVGGTGVGVAVAGGNVAVAVGVEVNASVGVEVGGAVLVGSTVAVGGCGVDVGESAGAAQAHTTQVVTHKPIRNFIRLREAVSRSNPLTPFPPLPKRLTRKHRKVPPPSPGVQRRGQGADATLAGNQARAERR